ncbi:MAG TPA: peptidylprolyl isomerase [Casimicrobiaceae bacterium]|nr:peptidylprolyl isomerase [Casimicrobiaceae bacterium]
MTTRTDFAAVRELLSQRAIREGLCAAGAPRDDVDAAIETLLSHDVAVPAPTVDECRRWYERHASAHCAGELAFVRHILFAVTAGTPIEPLRRKAEATLHELRRSPERFEERARELSNCPSGAQGGVLGQVSRGETAAEFESAIFGNEAIGVLPTLVNTRYGFHVVAVDRRVAGRRPPFEIVHAQIAERMSELSWTRALAQYVRVLAREANGLECGEATNPLVQ